MADVVVQTRRSGIGCNIKTQGPDVGNPGTSRFAGCKPTCEARIWSLLRRD